VEKVEKTSGFQKKSYSEINLVVIIGMKFLLKSRSLSGNYHGI